VAKEPGNADKAVIPTNAREKTPFPIVICFSDHDISLHNAPCALRSSALCDIELSAERIGLAAPRRA
jgi:hypothetical protein